ncbi:YezD family protein [Paenibacillus glycanilyticus]|uniref:YezD family protein n=1 Tax=Paenibacillus glycanilyticus TaxID=126569 RepID=UPI00203A5D87|nr:YezD family protein [Paenibacillus glycanilyticus]MCM3629248.1 YezD family protein [Paenibacillus glycanilyticus]
MAKPLEVDQVWLDRILEQVNGLQYGSVNITVHDGRIVQIDRTERTRYDQPSHKQQSDPQKATGNGEQLRAVAQ